VAKAPAKERKNSRKPRLRGEERRHDILAKAASLVRAKGEGRVTTRLIAKEASISEALLYQHFPTKDELFREVSVIINARLPPLDEYFAEAEPSSRVLIEYLYLVTYLALSPDVHTGDSKLPRMLLESLLSDGSLLRTHIKRRWSLIGDLLRDSLAAARDAGHLVSGEGEREDAASLELMLSHQLVIMAHCVRFMTEQPIVGGELSSRQVIERTAVFVMRGLGFKDGVIKRLYRPDKIMAKFTQRSTL
jgi:AcrR family transcriptional regulator